MSEVEHIRCSLHTGTCRLRILRMCFISDLCLCLASIAKDFWELEVPKGYQSCVNDSICCFLTPGKQRNIWECIDISAEMLHIKSCYCEFLRMFSSLCWISFAYYFLCWCDKKKSRKNWVDLQWYLDHCSFEIFLHYTSFLACNYVKMYFEISEFHYKLKVKIRVS